MAPYEVTTDCAAAYPPALATVLPDALHETGKMSQQRIERDHQHRKGRVRGMHGFKTPAGARVLCRAHAFLRNLRCGFYDLRRTIEAPSLRVVPTVVDGLGYANSRATDVVAVANAAARPRTLSPSTDSRHAHPGITQ
jgi:hypothetical protein